MSDRDSKRKPGKVRFDSGSGSSRTSTVGGSSTSSGHSGSQYTPEYNIGALQRSLQATLVEMDGWKNRATESEKREVADQARIKGLELYKEELDDTNAELQKKVLDLTKENSRMSRKLEKYEARSPPSSPDGSKPRRSDSKSSPKHTDANTHNAHLKERFTRNVDSSSEGSTSKPSKPPSSSKAQPAPHRSGSVRRQSISSASSPHAERGPSAYDHGYGSASPVSPSSGPRRTEYIVASPPPPHYHHHQQQQMMATTPYPAQMYATTPRTAVPMQYVHGPSYVGAYGAETGNYQPHPLPR